MRRKRSHARCPEVLLVDPACVVGIGRHARKPLRDGVDVVAVLWEELIARASADAFAIVDWKVPPDLERNTTIGRKRFW